MELTVGATSHDRNLSVISSCNTQCCCNVLQYFGYAELGFSVLRSLQKYLDSMCPRDLSDRHLSYLSKVHLVSIQARSSHTLVCCSKGLRDCCSKGTAPVHCSTRVGCSIGSARVCCPTVSARDCCSPVHCSAPNLCSKDPHAPCFNFSWHRWVLQPHLGQPSKKDSTSWNKHWKGCGFNQTSKRSSCNRPSRLGRKDGTCSMRISESSVKISRPPQRVWMSSRKESSPISRTLPTFMGVLDIASVR